MSARDSRSSRVAPAMPPRRINNNNASRASPSALAFGRDATATADDDEAMRTAAVDALLAAMPHYAHQRDTLLWLPEDVWDFGDAAAAPSAKGAIEVEVVHGVSSAHGTANSGSTSIKTGRNTTARDIVRQWCQAHDCFPVHAALHLLLLSATSATAMADSDRPANIVRARRKNGGDEPRFAVDLRANYGGDPLPSSAPSRNLQCMYYFQSFPNSYFLF